MRTRANEAMNLRAASAAAVSEAVDNAASKRRRPGPQLMAGAFGRLRTQAGMP